MKIPTRLRILCKANHGASLIELALVTPMLLVLVFGALDLGRGYFVFLELVNAAHAGAEYGSLHRPIDTAGMITAATKSSELSVTFDTPKAAYGCECSDNSSANNTYSENCTTVPTCTAPATKVYRFQVKTTAVYTPLVPWKGTAWMGAVSSSYAWSSTATMRGIYP
jgi:Flp pilus assembly protein TadG